MNDWVCPSPVLWLRVWSGGGGELSWAEQSRAALSWAGAIHTDRKRTTLPSHFQSKIHSYLFFNIFFFVLCIYWLPLHTYHFCSSFTSKMPASVNVQSKDQKTSSLTLMLSAMCIFELHNLFIDFLLFLFSFWVPIIDTSSKISISFVRIFCGSSTMKPFFQPEGESHSR